MTEWDEALAASRAEFIERLEQRGFTLDGPNRLTGLVLASESAHQITVTLPDGFPFAPPTVHPDADLAASWHRELDGAMCLYPVAGRESLPWLNPDDFIATVQRWLHESSTGWTDDSPDLDLDRYFYASDDSRLLVYSGIEALLHRYVRFRRDPHVIALVGPGAVPSKTVTDKRRAFGYVADIGEPGHPPHDWNQVAALLDPVVSITIDKAIRDGRIHYVLLRYARQSHNAVLALEAHHTDAGIELRALASAPADTATLTLRSGPQAPVLADKTVLVVGAGALGSFICDALARSGLGHLTVRDGDIVRPGNLVRHLVDERQIGRNKADAVRDTICDRTYNVTTVTAAPRNLTDPTEASALLADHDLVIDATADAAASAVLATAARVTATQIISTCLQADGRVLRVDIIPTISGPPHPQTVQDITLGPVAYEAGCGDPVSLTPPYAVTEAASVAARHAVGILTGAPVTDAGVVHDYR